MRIVLSISFLPTLFLGAAAAVHVSDPGKSIEVPAETAEADAPVRSIPEQLRIIADEAGTSLNPYLGRAQLGRLQEALSLVSTGDQIAAHWRVLLEIGNNELRLGMIDEAVKSVESSLAIAVEGGVRKRDLNQIRFRLGVANLRRGELANCCHRFTPDSCILPIRGEGIHEETSGSEAAFELFISVLENARARGPLALRAQWLLNIAAMTLGEYPDRVPKEYLISPEVFESDEEIPKFIQEGTERGVGSVNLAGGIAIEDFNGDGWLDLVSSTSDTSGSMHVLLNDKEGGFIEQPNALAEQLGGLNLIQADYDNDGDTDIFVLRGAWWSEWGKHPNSLLRNDGNASFVDVTIEAGLAEDAHPTQTAAWGDYDNDGDLDLYIGNESSDNRLASQLFRNQGDGTFVEVTKAAGVENLHYAKGVVWGDFDNDRLLDLYVSNMAAPNRLYHNQGDGTFVDVGKEMGVHKPISGFPCWFFDYDNDGRLDIYAGAYGGKGSPPDIADVAASYMGRNHGGEKDYIYRNTTRGFKSVGPDLGLSRYSLPMGVNFGDIDNDGWLDFYLGTGFPALEALMPNVMYRNRNGIGFSDVTSAGGFGHLQKGHAIAFADFDQDGDQDVFQQMGGAFPKDEFSNALYVNPGTDNHWITIRAVGTKSNRSAIGARIHLVLQEGETERHIHRAVNSGASFGANPFLIEIGLGSADVVKSLEIYWPTSDLTQRFEDVAGDRRYKVVEGAEELEEL